jgi:pyrroline-5-carboxylate reductase
MAASPTIGFVGGGQMANALVRGFVRGGVADKERIIVSDM